MVISGVGFRRQILLGRHLLVLLGKEGNSDDDAAAAAANMPRWRCRASGVGCCTASSPVICSNRDREEEEAAAAAAVLSLVSTAALSPPLSSRLLACADSDEMDEHMRGLGIPTYG